MLSLLGTLLAWAVAATQLGSSLHYALISHEICAEHGELEHTSGHSGEHASEHHAGHASEHDHQGAAVSNGASEGAHEHCGVFGRPEDKALVASPPSLEVVAQPSHGLALQPSCETVVVPQSARLLAAPKTSPPV